MLIFFENEFNLLIVFKEIFGEILVFVSLMIFFWEFICCLFVIVESKECEKDGVIVEIDIYI